MNKKLPSIFVNKNIKSNNKRVSHEKDNIVNIKYDDTCIKDKVLKILNDVDFIYRKHVIITYKDNLKKEVILMGLSGNNLITLDDGSIDIDNLKDIEKVDLTRYK